MLEKIIPMLLCSLVTGGVSSMGTVAAMDVHIDYLKENNIRQDKIIDGVVRRVSEVEKKVY